MEFAITHRIQLTDRSDEGFNVYFGANPRKALGATRNQSVKLARSLFVDFDHCRVDEAIERIDVAELPTPTITIDSGHGCHAYWLLAEAFTDLAVWTERQKDLISLVRSDKSIHNPERIMRLPGFRNHKEPPADCILIDCEPSRVFEWSELLPLIPKRKSETFESDGRHFAESVGAQIKEGGRNSNLASLAGTMQRRGMSADAIFAALERFSGQCTQ